MHFEGKGAALTALSGDFAAADPGGILVIKDDTMLKNVAASSGQPLDLLMESFKNYNKGLVKLGLAPDGIVFGIDMDGETGKRNFDIVWHIVPLK